MGDFKEYGAGAFNAWQNFNTLGASNLIKTDVEQQKAIKELDKALQDQPSMEAEVNALEASLAEFRKASEEALGLSKQMAQRGLPEETMNQFSEDIGAIQAGALRGVSELGGGLRTAGNTGLNLTNKVRDMIALDAEARMKAERDYIDKLNSFNSAIAGFETNIAGAKGRQEAYNELDPYQRMLAEKQQLLNANMQTKQQYGELGKEAASMAAGGGFDNLFNYAPSKPKV